MSLVKSQDPSTQIVQPFRFSATSQEAAMDETPPSALSPTQPSQELVKRGSEALGNVAKEAKLVARIAELEKAVSKSAELLERAKTDSFEAGRNEGLRAADKFSEESLALLRKASEEAHAKLDKGLEAQVDIGIDIARAIIGRVLGEEAEMPAHVVQTAAVWKQQMADTSIVALRVSREDFPSEDALADLVPAVGQTQIEIDPSLKRGACVFDLRLGQMDASIPHQAKRADTFLLQMKTDEAN